MVSVELGTDYVTNNRIDHIRDFILMQHEQITKLDKALTVAEVLRKCAEDVNLCGEGN